jgi:hypothetical protein
MDPPLALEPDGVVREVTILVPDASFERAMAAEALMSASSIVASRIFVLVTAPVPRVRTPALVAVASHEKDP